MTEGWDAFVKKCIKIFKNKLIYIKTTNKDIHTPPSELYLCIYLQINHTVQTLSLKLLFISCHARFCLS